MKWVKKIILKIIIKQILKKIGGEKMNKIREFLSGKKTYLVCIGLIIEAVIEYIADGDLGQLINKIIIAIGGMSMRAGIKKGEIK